MTAARVFLSEAAEFDISKSFAWYRERSPLAADAFRAEVVGNPGLMT